MISSGFARVRKGYATVGAGQVHYRVAGHGTPVVLLPDSPRSSAAYAELCSWLADEFTAIALDLPGYGNSLPPPVNGETDLAHFAAAVADTLTALGIERCPIYGMHASAKLALQLAVTYPQRVSVAVLEGLALPLEMPDARFLERHLPPFELSDDGSHLAREWTRVRDLQRFYPWFAHDERARLNVDAPNEQALHAYCVDLFSAGSHYFRLESAALRSNALPLIERVGARTILMGRENDLFYRYLDALPERLPATVTLERLSSDPERWRERLRAIFRECADSPRVPAPALPGAMSTAATAEELRGYVELPHGQVHVRRQGSGSGRPVLLLHETPGSSTQMRALMRELSRDRPVFAIDLPGCGDSDPVPNPEIANYNLVMLGLLDKLRLTSVDLVAEFSATPLTIELARTAPGRIHRMVWDGVFLLTASERRALRNNYCPPLRPSVDGAHLLALWHRLRDQQLSWPWYERSKIGVRRHSPEIGAERLHSILVDVIKQPAQYGEFCLAAFEYPVKDMLQQVAQPVLLSEIAGDVRYQWTSKAARRLAERTVAERPGGVAEQARSWGAFFSR